VRRRMHLRRRKHVTFRRVVKTSAFSATSRM
jgi:hypothetical protein